MPLPPLCWPQSSAAPDTMRRISAKSPPQRLSLCFLPSPPTEECWKRRDIGHGNAEQQAHDFGILAMKLICSKEKGRWNKWFRSPAIFLNTADLRNLFFLQIIFYFLRRVGPKMLIPSAAEPFPSHESGGHVEQEPRTTLPTASP